jgi:hypothetical protein
LGRHSKPSRITQGAALAAPTLASVAAAFCIAPSAVAAPAVAAGPQAAVLTAAAGNPAPAALRMAAAVRYRVRPGDSLSSIAQHFYGDADAWPVIYWHNRASIRWADYLDAGQVLTIPPRAGRTPSAPAALAPPVAAPATAPAQEAQPAPGVVQAATPTAAYTGGAPGGSFGACVIARESGGNAQIMNGTGHYGLYQFSAGTWAAYGGNPADFGNASVAEQNQVFANALAAGGESNWAPYDGC